MFSVYHWISKERFFIKREYHSLKQNFKNNWNISLAIKMIWNSCIRSGEKLILSSHPFTFCMIHNQHSKLSLAFFTTSWMSELSFSRLGIDFHKTSNSITIGAQRLFGKNVRTALICHAIDSLYQIYYLAHIYSFVSLCVCYKCTHPSTYFCCTYNCTKKKFHNFLHSTIGILLKIRYNLLSLYLHIECFRYWHVLYCLLIKLLNTKFFQQSDTYMIKKSLSEYIRSSKPNNPALIV